MIKTCFMWFIASELYFLKWVSRTGGRLKWGAGAVAFGCFQCFACELPHAKHVRNLLWDQVL